MLGWVGDATGCCPGRMGLAGEGNWNICSDYWIKQEDRSVSSHLLTDLSRVAPPGHVLGPDSLFDAVHLLLVALAVAGGVLLGFLQRRFQGLDPLSRSTKALLQFWKLTAKVCIITNQLRRKRNRYIVSFVRKTARSKTQSERWKLKGF